MAKKKDTWISRKAVKIAILAVSLVVLIYFLYWKSMLFLTKPLTLNDNFTVRVPVLWDLVKYTGDYDFGKSFEGGFYSGEALGKKASFTVNEYNFDFSHYIKTHDLGGLPFSEMRISGKEALLFEPISSSFGNWKIYLINLDGNTLGIEINYLNEETNAFERYILKKSEDKIIDSITFKN